MSSFHSRAVARRKQLIAGRATAYRNVPTWSEQLLWGAIRRGALGVSFRRQVPVGPGFIADFYAAELRLVVEVDGPVHALKLTSDARRERELRRLGFTVLRLPSALVESELPVAAERIREIVEALRSGA